MDTIRRRALFGLLAVLVIAVAVNYVFSRSGTPGDNSPEAGFARDMGVHHAQAVDMSIIVRDATKEDDLRTLTYDIIVTQATQKGIMMGWLDQWDLTQGSGRPPMAWMNAHGHTAPAIRSGLMPGMATPDELNRLKQTTGKDAEVLFLQLMIKHHKGGVEMAKGLLSLSKRDEVRDLAQGMVNTQQGEVDLMTTMLAKRGAQP